MRTIVLTLFVVFLSLKLTHLIDWSWWRVTSPIWISLILVVYAAVVVISLDRKGKLKWLG